MSNDKTDPPATKPPTGGTMLSELLSVSNAGPRGSDGYRLVRRGTSKLIDDLLRSADAAPKLDRALVEAMIAEIDGRLSDQVNEILHHPQVRRLESAWRGVKHLVDRIDFGQNIALELVNATKDDLRLDFEDASAITGAGLYRTVYHQHFGTLGGEPYGVICSTHEFGPGGDDVYLLKQCAAVAAVAHVPFLANAGPAMFGLSSFADMPRIRDIPALMEGPQYARWNALRESEDARYLALCMPRFMLRSPYTEPVYVPPEAQAFTPNSVATGEPPVTAFAFTEDIIDRHERYLWGPASIAMTARIADSFARYHWCPNIIGPQGGGGVERLAVHVYEQGGELKTKPATEVALDDNSEQDLAEQGFIGLVYRQHTTEAAFLSANSIQRPRLFPRTPEGQAQQASFALGGRLPYLFVITRIAHYMKVLQREQIGTWKSRADLERELNLWLRGYVSDMPDAPAEVRARRPLRRAQVTVEEVPGQASWFRCALAIEPHLKVDGAYFSLSLVGKLDRAAS